MTRAERRRFLSRASTVTRLVVAGSLVVVSLVLTALGDRLWGVGAIVGLFELGGVLRVIDGIPRVITRITPIGAHLGVGFGTELVSRAAATTTTEQTYESILGVERRGTLVVIDSRDGSRFYFPGGLVHDAELERIRALVAAGGHR